MKFRIRTEKSRAAGLVGCFLVLAAGLIAAPGAAQATPTLEIQVFVVDPTTNVVEAYESFTPTFDTDFSFDLVPSGQSSFGAYGTHVGYTGGTITGSFASGSPTDIVTQNHIKSASFSSPSTASGNIYLAFTELNIAGGGSTLFTFTDTTIFKVLKSTVGFNFYYSNTDAPFSTSTVGSTFTHLTTSVDPSILPAVSTYSTAGDTSFSIPTTDVTLPTSSLYSETAVFKLVPASGANPTLDAEVTSVPEPASLALLGSGAAALWLAGGRRRKGSPRAL